LHNEKGRSAQLVILDRVALHLHRFHFSSQRW